MTAKETLLQAVEELPPEYIVDLAEYAQRLRLPFPTNSRSKIFPCPLQPRRLGKRRVAR